MGKRKKKEYCSILDKCDDISANIIKMTFSGYLSTIPFICLIATLAFNEIYIAALKINNISKFFALGSLC